MVHILVVYEIRDNEIKKVSFEVTSQARRMVKQVNGKVSALIMGTGVRQFSDLPGQYGADGIYLIDNPELSKYSPDAQAKIISKVAKDINATHIFMGATSRGKDLLPRAAFLLESSLAQDIIDLKMENDKIVYTRPIIGGKLLSELTIESKIELATFRPNIFAIEQDPISATVETLTVELPTPRLVVEEEIKTTGSSLDVTEAEVIVSGGRGLKGPENWYLIEKLAELLGAAMGASRAVVDAGWRDHQEQVGQTGKTVSPNLYIACGISGAIQHLAGMSSSKYIVAINKDPDAPVFKIADYGIIGDVLEILPALTEEIKKYKK
jgi:electron transfer flavoprotein alpha subunit